jgi:hypothetical protein
VKVRHGWKAEEIYGADAFFDAKQARNVVVTKDDNRGSGPSGEFSNT